MKTVYNDTAYKNKSVYNGIFFGLREIPILWMYFELAYNDIHFDSNMARRKKLACIEVVAQPKQILLSVWQPNTIRAMH